MKAIKRNGVILAIQDWKQMGRKKPVLAVYVEEKNTWYKVASFNSEETAEWFANEIMERFFSGIAK